LCTLLQVEDEVIMQTISDEMRAPLRKAALELAYADALARAHCGASPEFGYLSLYTNSTSGRNSRASMQGSFAALPNFPNRNLQLPAAFQVAAPQWAEPLSPSSNSTAMFSLRPVPANALGAEALLDYDWDLLAADEAGVVDAVVAMFAYHGSLVHHDVSPRKLQGFIEMVAENYHAQNPYHNFEHGVSVMHCCFVTLTKSKRCVAALFWQRPWRACAVLGCRSWGPFFFGKAPSGVFKGLCGPKKGYVVRKKAL